MSVTDAPDWQKVVVTVPSGGVTQDAPDWQNTVVSPGGTPVGGGQALDRPSAATYALTGWDFPQNDATSLVGLVSGDMYLMSTVAYQAESVGSMWMGYSLPTGVALVTDECYVGIYDGNTTALLVGSAAGAFEAHAVSGTYFAVPFSTRWAATAGYPVVLAVLLNTTGGNAQFAGIQQAIAWPASASLVNWISGQGPFTALPGGFSTAGAVATAALPWLGFAQ